MKQRDRENPRYIEVKVRFNETELALLDALADLEEIPRAALLREIAIRRAHMINVEQHRKEEAA